MENEKRLIDANALLDEIRKSKDGHHHTEYEILANHHMEHDVFMDLVDCAPTVDAVEVVHGHWSILDENCCVCSVCHNHSIQDYYYCPECGAKMDGERSAKMKGKNDYSYIVVDDRKAYVAIADCPFRLVIEDGEYVGWYYCGEGG